MAQVKYITQIAVKDIEVTDKETLLDAALRSSLKVPHSCLEGICSHCEAEVVEGKVDVIPGYETLKHPKVVKTCQSFPVSTTCTLKYIRKP